MKAIVEFGTMEDSKPVTGSVWKHRNHAKHICPSCKDAAALATNLIYVMSDGTDDYTVHGLGSVSRARPRIVWWNKDRTKWLCVSALDGIMRGPYQYWK